MRIQRMVKCKWCGYKAKREWAYKYWHFVSCFESLISPNDLIDIVWVKTWWQCNNHDGYTQANRFHDIDGFTYFLSWKFPFVRKS